MVWQFRVLSVLVGNLGSVPITHINNARLPATLVPEDLIPSPASTGTHTHVAPINSEKHTHTYT